MPQEDSNLHNHFQRVVCCHYTMGQAAPVATGGVGCRPGRARPKLGGSGRADHDSLRSRPSLAGRQRVLLLFSPDPVPSTLDPALSALNGAPSADERSAIGVLGGLGPYAGLDLVRAIFDETEAHADQEHLPVALISYSNRIPDRAAWLADETAPSPIPAMMEVLRRLDDAGCAVAGIPCNTAHAPAIYDRLHEGLLADGREIRLLHIVDAIVQNVSEVAPGASHIGVLATSSSVSNRLHQIGLEAAGLQAVVPDTAHQTAVQETIYGPWGLKAQSAPPDPRSREALLAATEHLAARGADAVILGCTELPLAIPERRHEGTPFVNSTRALARALIRATHPEKLRFARTVAA